MSDIVRTKSLSKTLAFVLVVLVFIVIGPAVGSLSLWTGSNFSALLSGNMNIAYFFRGFLFVLMFGYLLGFVFALIAGIFVSIVGIWAKWNNLLVPVIAAGIAALLGIYVSPALFKAKADIAATPWLFPICLPAAFVCWFLTRRIVRATWQNA
jgi:hypothetical protein